MDLKNWGNSWTLIFAAYVNPSHDSKGRRRRGRDSVKEHIKWADGHTFIKQYFTKKTKETTPPLPSRASSNINNNIEGNFNRESEEDMEELGGLC
jgi:hypothetical protein